MAENLPVNFAIPGENIISSYSYTDIAEGTGIQPLYCFASRPGGTLTYHMDKNAIECGGIGADTTEGPQERRFLFDNSSVSFDLGDFNAPRVVRGKAFVTFTIVALGGLSGAQTVTIEVLKNSTQIATTTITTQSAAGSAKSFCASMTIPETQFGIGDNLILKFTCTESKHIFLEHDPSNRSEADAFLVNGKTYPATNSTITPTKCMFYVPFKIEN